MKDKIIIGLLVLVVAAGLVAFVYGTKLLNMASTPITVHEVEPGVRCAVMVAGEGVAIDCWYVNQTNP